MFYFSLLQDFVSTLKFAYLESNQKLAFVNRILHKDGPAYVSTEENALKGLCLALRYGEVADTWLFLLSTMPETNRTRKA